MELKIEARGIDLRQGWQERIEEEKQKLLRHYPDLVLHLRVSIEATSGHKEGGFEIKLVAAIPQDTVVVNRHAESVRTALTESFDVLTLQLKEIQRKKRKNQKTPVEAAMDQVGLIKKVFSAESYGFIVTPDDKEVYFHKNAIKGCGIDELQAGDKVIFSETTGDKGPQAAWLRKA